MKISYNFLIVLLVAFIFSGCASFKSSSVSRSSFYSSSAKPELYKATVTGHNVRLREHATTDSRILGRLSKKESVYVDKWKTHNYWIAVYSPGLRQAGWVWGGYLDLGYTTLDFEGHHRLVKTDEDEKEIWYIDEAGRRYFSRKTTQKKKSNRRITFLSPLGKTYITSPYGNRKYHPVYGGGGSKRHKGIDLRARVGTPTKAIASGRVKSLRYAPDYGHIITIEHKNGWRSRYAHLSRYRVRKGQYIKAGDVIAATGNTGITTGPHLHLELIHNGRHVNPENYIDF